MKKSLLVPSFALSGLIVGYPIFGKWVRKYVSFDILFPYGGNGFQSMLRSHTGIEDIRNKMVLRGAVGVHVC